MFTVDKPVGRLIEARFASPLTLEEVQNSVKMAHALVSTAPGQVVTCTDLTELDLVPINAVDLVTDLFTRDAPKIERAGLFVRGNTASVQMEHMIRRASLRNRKTFRDMESLEAWLGEVLNAVERARLTQFLRRTRYY
jgi:hypothetical protein